MSSKPVTVTADNIFVFHALIVSRRFLNGDVSKPIPLRTALGIKRQNIIMAIEIIDCARTSLLKVNDLVLEPFSTSDPLTEEVQGKI